MGKATGEVCMIKEGYSGRSGAVDEFRAFCDKEGIENKWGCWA